MLEKGFSNPTDRVVRLRNMILTAKPYVESERAVLATKHIKKQNNCPRLCVVLKWWKKSLTNYR